MSAFSLCISSSRVLRASRLASRITAHPSWVTCTPTSSSYSTRSDDQAPPEDHRPKCSITTYSTKSTQHASLLAEHLAIPFSAPGAQGEEPASQSDFLLVVSDQERLMLQNTGLPHNYYVDFYQMHHQFCSTVPRWADWLQYLASSEPPPPELTSQILAYAKKPRYKVLRHLLPQHHKLHQSLLNADFRNLHMLDLSGGMGVNAYIYAHAGVNVTLVEKDPVLYSLLYEGYQLAKSLPGLADVMKRINLVHADPLEYMKKHLPTTEQNNSSEESIKLPKKKKRRKKPTLKQEDPWDVVLLEPRYYDGIASQQGYYQKNVEAVLKPYLEQDMDWVEYAHQIQDLYETALSVSPVLIKYPVMSTRYMERGKWLTQKHEAQYIDRVYKRFSDSEYEYQLYVAPSDERRSMLKSEEAVQQQKQYVSLKFKQHQRKTRKFGGKEALRMHERENKYKVIELVDDKTPYAADELSALDIESLKRNTQAARRQRKARDGAEESV